MELYVITVCISHAHAYVHICPQKCEYLKWYSNSVEFNSEMPQTGTTSFCIRCPLCFLFVPVYKQAWIISLLWVHNKSRYLTALIINFDTISHQPQLTNIILFKNQLSTEKTGVYDHFILKSKTKCHDIVTKATFLKLIIDPGSSGHFLFPLVFS